MTTVWLTARGAGLAALVLLTISVSIGALVSGAGRGRGHATGRFIGQYVHRVAGALGIGVLVVHIATILADSYAHVGVLGAIVPFTSSFRATWVGLGTIAAYLLVIVAALGFARGRLATTALGAKVWRGLHGLSYAAWGFAMLHGFMSGTDSHVGWVRMLYLVCGATVGGALVLRLTSPNRPDLVRGAPAPRVRQAVSR